MDQSIGFASDRMAATSMMIDMGFQLIRTRTGTIEQWMEDA